MSRDVVYSHLTAYGIIRSYTFWYHHGEVLWNNWRGDLCRHYVKPAKNMQQAIKNCPEDFPQADWEWLVKEHFYSKLFTTEMMLLTCIVI
jgi:hypothetical protein